MEAKLKFQRMIEKRKAKKEKKIMESIRANLAFFGHDVSIYSDDEIQDAIVRFGEIIAKAGITSKQATETFRQASLALKERLN